ncbi:Curli production assembly/transport component CsgF [Vreelandella boliviensis LC1]|uniref:Curli production assembly/transport component CsgF n=2 Tax=Vreelandella boliviensis TaxID=223527 RepID=A0A265DYU2_9GAMM|nr:Curli production assembly/transport component CsgF [Halomonas boliviensis LC1]OZT74430.1 curli production assembly protein CsgF [Halomonas boliviensis LC1]
MATTILASVLTLQASAGELIYTPINPSFGGDPFMGSYLLGKAQSQDTNTDPDARGIESLSSTERLIQSLESRLISQLISDVGSGNVGQGSFDSGDFSVVVSDEGGQLIVRVIDKVTGDVTNISVGGLLFNP